MSSDEYSVQNIYRYTRKSYKNDPNSSVNAFTETRGDPDNAVIPMCSCDVDPKGIVDDILHKKCPIIALAQQQLQRVTDETDRIFYENEVRCRSLYDLLMFFKDVMVGENRKVCMLGVLLTMSFITGLLLGSASCGTHLRKFNSPVFACIDNLFAVESRKQDTAIY